MRTYSRKAGKMRMTSERTSDIRLRILNFIREYQHKNGMPPTNREIGHAMDINSTGHVDYHLSMLERDGHIQREPRKSRGIKLLDQGPQGIPVMGSIAAGEPLEILEKPEQALEIGNQVPHQNTYALLVKGHSMIEDHICSGDYVVIKQQETCENGDIVVAVHMQQGGGSATLKRFFQEQDKVRLQPANSEMDPIVVPSSEWYNEWRIQGRVV